MTSLAPYLSCNGNCAEAMRFYVETFDRTVETLLTYGASSVANECTADSAKRVMYARLRCGERSIMAADCPLDQPYDGMRHISLCLSYDKVGASAMPVDRYGTPWMINGALAQL